MSQIYQKRLIKWYQKNKRSLPWRNTKNPYFIWISEVMLQQTTVNTVIPYYKKFIKKFKTIKSLAQAPHNLVLSYWSGLGYYSRVKNLHLSAQIIYQNKKFPKTYKELLTLPGFGAYTARAVSSLAFHEKVGVLDANVIRVLTRYLGYKKPWWTTLSQKILQEEVNKWMVKNPSAILNQALMELGALVCTSQKPTCTLCPLKQKCHSFKYNQISIIPLKKKPIPKKIWLWKPIICIKKNKIAFIKNHTLPVLKKYPFPPGIALKKTTPPLCYDFIHSITHYTIYTQISKLTLNSAQPILWYKIQDIQKTNPSNLIQKILKFKKILL